MKDVNTLISVDRSALYLQFTDAVYISQIRYFTNFLNNENKI